MYNTNKIIVIGFISVFLTFLTPLFDMFFRSHIQNLYRLTTGNKIEFYGKDIHFFETWMYYIGFCIFFFFFIFFNYEHNFREILKNLTFSILIFYVCMISISAIDANLKVIVCTACQDGIRKIHWNDINYGLIIGLSLILAILPTIVKLSKNR